MSAQLFTEFVRTHYGPMLGDSSTFDWLNLSAEPEVEFMRAFLETWFGHLPHDQTQKLQRRFSNRREHASAFFELYLHELLLRMGYQLDLPPISSEEKSRPDFLVLKDDRPLFWLEATSTNQPAEELEEDRRMAPIYELLNSIPSERFLVCVMSIHGPKDRPPSLSKLRDDVTAWLKRLGIQHPPMNQPHIEVDPDGRFDWLLDGWVIRLRAWFRPAELQSPGIKLLASYAPRGKWFVPGESIAGRIRDKAKNYGTLDLPLVVAVNVLNDERRGIDVWTALRKAWRPGRTARATVSAAVIGFLPNALAAIFTTPYLVLNPYANHPLSADLWSLPQENISEQGLLPSHNQRVSAPELLGIDSGRAIVTASWGLG